MIINRTTGQIAYHTLNFKMRDGTYCGLELVQYDYDGKVLDRPLEDGEEFIPPEANKKI